MVEISLLDVLRIVKNLPSFSHFAKASLVVKLPDVKCIVHDITHDNAIIAFSLLAPRLYILDHCCLL